VANKGVNQILNKSELRDIGAKVEAGQRVSEDDCLRLFRSHDLAAIGAMANARPRKKWVAAVKRFVSE